jgi:hypothetical protein
MSRDNLYKQFGPRLLEALSRVILDEINILRVEAGLSERTLSQLVAALETKLTEISKYDWMD